jgi:hypothetical protein
MEVSSYSWGGIVSTWVGWFVFGANDANVNSYTTEA